VYSQMAYIGTGLALCIASQCTNHTGLALCIDTSLSLSGTEVESVYSGYINLIVFGMIERESANLRNLIELNGTGDRSLNVISET